MHEQARTCQANCFLRAICSWIVTPYLFSIICGEKVTSTFNVRLHSLKAKEQNIYSVAFASVDTRLWSIVDSESVWLSWDLGWRSTCCQQRAFLWNFESFFAVTSPGEVGVAHVPLYWEDLRELWNIPLLELHIVVNLLENQMSAWRSRNFSFLSDKTSVDSR